MVYLNFEARNSSFVNFNLIKSQRTSNKSRLKDFWHQRHGLMDLKNNLSYCKINYSTINFLEKEAKLITKYLYELIPLLDDFAKTAIKNFIKQDLKGM